VSEGLKRAERYLAFVGADSKKRRGASPLDIFVCSPDNCPLKPRLVAAPACPRAAAGPFNGAALRGVGGKTSQQPAHGNPSGPTSLCD
jgi:hypothetical protein